ncbi:MAG: OsmC family protein [Anaerolineae bacterium]|nr:OsmC family protein [Anaerolineae bacterium]
MELTVQHVDGMRFLATADGHTAVVDAALQDGGGGTALSAPQMFAAALGACILEFVANSCRLSDVPVGRLSVQVAYEEVPRPRRVGDLKAAIQIEPEPPEKVKQRLLGVARHATLISTLARPPEVEICFAGAEGSSG